MPSLNSVELIGRLGADPEMRYTPSGAAVTQFNVAVDHNFKDKVSQEWQSDTTWVRCIAWNDLGERLAEYLRKGRLVYVEGRLVIRKYTDKDGAPRYATEVVLNRGFALDKCDTDAAAEEPAAPAPRQEPADDDLDSLPF